MKKGLLYTDVHLEKGGRFELVIQIVADILFTALKLGVSSFPKGEL